MEVPIYEGNLNVKKFLDWISTLDNYFDYEKIDDENILKHDVTILRGHTTLWWDKLQDDSRRKGKAKIKSWDITIAKIKDKSIPKDYQLNRFTRFQNLRQKDL